MLNKICSPVSPQMVIPPTSFHFIALHYSNHKACSTIFSSREGNLQERQIRSQHSKRNKQSTYLIPVYPKVIWIFLIIPAETVNMTDTCEIHLGGWTGQLNLYQAPSCTMQQIILQLHIQQTIIECLKFNIPGILSNIYITFIKREPCS